MDLEAASRWENLQAAPDRCVCFTLDLSERKRAESTLEDMRAQHALDARYRALLDTAPDAIENYTNRSPYPIFHLLREASVARAVEAFPEAAEIYERNQQTLRELGHEGWRAWLAGPPSP